MRLAMYGMPWLDEKEPGNPEKMIFMEDVDQVFCDGLAIRFVTAFDDREGWVEFLARDCKDRIIIEGDQAKRCRLEGEITFTLKGRNR